MALLRAFFVRIRHTRHKNSVYVDNTTVNVSKCFKNPEYCIVTFNSVHLLQRRVFTVSGYFTFHCFRYICWNNSSLYSFQRKLARLPIDKKEIRAYTNKDRVTRRKSAIARQVVMSWKTIEAEYAEIYVAWKWEPSLMWCTSIERK